MASDDIERKLTTILAIDVVGYSRHTEKDEEATVRALHGRWDIVERCVDGHGGRILSAGGEGWRRLWLTRRYPSFDQLRGDSEFRALMDRIRIEIERARAGIVDYESSLSPRDPAAPERSTAGLSPA